LLLDANTVAWLHDVSDHKSYHKSDHKSYHKSDHKSYHKSDHNGKLDCKLDEFGFKNIPNFAEIKRVIKLISFSSENKDEFIRTETGKRLAITLHQEMVDELNKM